MDLNDKLPGETWHEFEMRCQRHDFLQEIREATTIDEIKQLLIAIVNVTFPR